MSIKLKLTILFLAVALIPTLLIVAISFQNYRNSIENTHLAALQHLSIYKTETIQTYFAGLKEQIRMAQAFYNVKRNLPILTKFARDPNNPEFIAAKKMLDEQLQPTQRVLALHDIMLTDPNGKVVYSTDPVHYWQEFSKPLPGPEQQIAFEERTKGVYFSNVFALKERNDRLEMLLTAPAYDFNDAFIGVIAFEIDMAPIYALVQDVTGLGRTGETLIGRKTGNQAIYINPLRHDPAAALKRKITLGETAAYPIQQAVQGKTGAGIAVDYRGKKVIAAWRYIPSLDWGLVAKIDQSEAFADVANLQKLVAIVLFLILILAGLMAFSIARSIAEPVRRLAEGAAIIGSGDLDFKVGTDSNDEIGQLSRSFDQMTHDLKTTTASRDELNREVARRMRTEDELRKSEERFRTMANAIQQLAWIARPDGYIIWYNQRWYDYTGTTAEQMEGWGWQSVHDPVLLPKILEQWKASITHGTLFEMEFPLRGADGHFRQFLTRGVPLKDAQGNVVQWFGTNTDVNDIKQAEQEIRRNLEELTRFNQLMVGRELRMIDLKKEVNDLCDKLGQQKRHSLDFEKEQQ